MKVVSLSAAMSPSVVIMGLLAVAVLAIALTGARVPLLSDVRVRLAVLLVLGMAMCAQEGIGPVASGPDAPSLVR
jgi:hypothetical protein